MSTRQEVRLRMEAMWRRLKGHAAPAKVARSEAKTAEGNEAEKPARRRLWWEEKD